LADAPAASDATHPTDADVPPRRHHRLPHRGQPRPLRQINRGLRVLGPGLITGAADDDPSGITTYSQAGATFGTGQLWLILYMVPLMIAVQEMCGRIGLVTGRGIAGVVRKHYRRELLFGALALVLIANTINVGTDLGAMAIAAQLLLPGVSFAPLVIGFALGVLLLEIFIPYRFYARILKWLTLSLFAYIVTGFVVARGWEAALRDTVVPHIELTPAFLLLVVAVLGTTISPYLFFWQASEEVEENILHHRHLSPEHDKHRLGMAQRLQLRRLRVDTTLGMLLCAGSNWFILYTTASTLHVHGITNITTASEAARALVPLVSTFPNAGRIAEGLFAVGIIGTGLLAVPILAGSAAYGVAETFGWREGLYRPVGHARGFYGVIALATLIGVTLNFLGVNPIQALVYTAVLNGIATVPLLALILLVANNRKVMGEHTNGWLSNVVGIVATLAMGAAAVALVVSIWWR
jgi:NRAMP (natural resistance-associated macrophage protein)-like metal ion transporter